MNFFRKYKIYLKLATCLFQFNSYADFNNELPTNLNLQENKETHSNTHNPSNTVRKKYENDKKEKINTEKGTKLPSENSDLAKHNVNAPVYFKGNSAEGSRKTGILNLLGNVEIIQDDTTLTSDKAQLFGSTGTTFGSGSRSIQKAIAIGNVHINKKSSLNSPEMKATANTIEFLVPQKIMILKGKAKVWKAQEYVNAEYIEMNLETGDIKLKEPHGTVDPKSSANLNKNNEKKSSSKVTK
ncbi:LptA/OstA family protein [Pigmentibacter sp. JX0631]|uniref:LptA/OstA family protein n=1 Tax=Pigmentibacter sp. JX0631 TaxID=2976982 RepID=UPI002469BFD8|nr:LptA/OstA family protein [Pigmentibacter sp. JX0631]WGL58724.1 LptA/OstA family protein [Pigmentibacter sp. JX0631]